MTPGARVGTTLGTYIPITYPRRVPMGIVAT